MGATKDSDSLAVTVCIELIPYCPLSLADATEEQVQQDDKSLSNDFLSVSPDGSGTTSAGDEKKSFPRASYKTQPCRFFISKKGCSKGAQCTYAHDEVQFQSALTLTPNFYKTRLCSLFTKVGTCSLGDLCTFAHGREQLCQRGTRQLNYALQNATLSEKNEDSTRCSRPVNLTDTPKALSPDCITMSELFNQCPQNLLVGPLASSQNSRGPGASNLCGIRDPLLAAQDWTFGPHLATSGSSFAMERSATVSSVPSAAKSSEGWP